MPILNPNSTNYVHPWEPNLADLHTAMQYNDNGEPELRVHVHGISLDGNVLVDKVRVEVDASHNTISDTHPVPVTIKNSSLAVTGTFWPDTQPVSGTVAVSSLPEVEIKNDSGNPLNITGSVTTIGGSAQGKLWTTQVAEGTVPGYSTVQMSGYNPSSSNGDSVWASGTAYPWSSLATAQTLYLKSSTNNASDRGLSITIVGLDSNYDALSETVTLNASDSRTAVSTTNQFLRIFYMMVSNATTNSGDITATVTSGSGTVVNKMLSGRGIGYTGSYTIPRGYTGYLWKGDASSTGATVVNFRVRHFGQSFLITHVAIVDNSTYIYDFPFPPQLPEKTDMACDLEVGAGKTAINFVVLLKAN